MKSKLLSYLAKIVGVALIYFLTAKIGLSMALGEVPVTLVWPPTGLALAILMLFGRRYGSGITLGAFLVNSSTGASMGFALGAAAGNTLEAIAGAYLLRNWVKLNASFSRIHDVVGFLTVGVILITTISPTFGVTSLCLSGMASWAAFGDIWLVWWLGDALGALIITPFILTWSARPHLDWRGWKIVEACSLLVIVVLLSLLAFSYWSLLEPDLGLLAYFIFPTLIWAALRFSPREAATVSLITTAIAVSGTIQGFGPFVQPSLSGAQVFLLGYTLAVAVVGLLLAAAMSERQQSKLAYERLLRQIGDSPSGFENLAHQQTELPQALQPIWLVAPLLLVFITTAIIVFLYQLSQKLLLPAMSELDELTSNLLFAGFTAMVASYFVLRQQQLLYQGMLTEAIERKRAEERQQMLVERTRELEHLTQQLEFQVAERQQAEAALRQSEARFKAFMDHSPLVAFIKDDQGYYIYGNRAWAEQFDQPLVELLGKTDADLWPPPVVKDFTKSDAVTQATGSNSEVITLTSLLTTTPRYWTVFKFSITDHLNRQLIGGICLDVTEQKLTSAALQASEERFRQAIASISDHLYVARITPLGWQNEFVSPQVEVLSGYPVESYSGGSNFWLDEVVHPEDRARLLAVQQRWFATGTGGEIEYRLIRADGQLVWVRDSVRVVDTSEGKKIYGVIGNITERKKLEEQLRQAQKMEAIGKLAGGVAHDFNNLLTVINGYTDLLLQHQDREANLAYKDIEQIKKAGERAATLTKQLLAFSRQQILQLQILDLNTVVMDLDNMLRRLIGEDVELVPRLQLDLGRVKADRGQIEQVILNLVLNARDAMPQGGHLTIETANTSPQQLVDLWPLEVMSDAYIMLAVTDTGHGIAPDILPHIFEPFFTTKEVGKGTGLGLATVYGIVTQSGGHVRVWSALGQGSCFKVYLPRIEIQAEATVIERDKTWLLQGVETVLVVEDEANVRALVSNILTKHGYTVLEAQNGHQALQRSQSYSAPIHLLLTDVVMPGMGGQELAERLVSLLPELRVLYMSGYADHPLNRNGQNSDHQLLLKPFSPEGLMRSVRRVLDGKLD